MIYHTQHTQAQYTCNFACSDNTCDNFVGGIWLSFWLSVLFSEPSKSRSISSVFISRYMITRGRPWNRLKRIRWLCTPQRKQMVGAWYFIVKLGLQITIWKLSDRHPWFKDKNDCRLQCIRFEESEITTNLDH